MLSVCLYMYPHIVARQRLGRNVTGTTNTCNNRIIVGRVVFYAVLAVSKESRLFLPEPLVKTSKLKFLL
jgi:hypothetical protein